jgi:hypothetical protein
MPKEDPQGKERGCDSFTHIEKLVLITTYFPNLTAR